MADKQDNDGLRMFETKQGLVSIPASEKPVAPQDFFANDRLPDGLKLYNVYQTEAGPVIEKSPAIPWTNEHDRKLEEIAVAAKNSIDEKGYYLRQTSRHIKSLARGTDKPLQDAFDAFHQIFHDVYRQSPGQLVDEWRMARNLPVKERGPDQRPGQEPEPEV